MKLNLKLITKKKLENSGEGTMKNIYQVENSYHLMEGLDSEFLVVADTIEEAKNVCLKLLAEDQESHIEAIKQSILDLEKSVNKNWGDPNDNSPAAQFVRRAQQSNLEKIVHFKKLLSEFNGYKRECLKVRHISPRLKNGHIQYIEEE